MATGTMTTYSRIIETGMSEMTMTLQLGLRTLALLALVAASTAVLVKPELVGGPGAGTSPALAAVLAIAHN